MKRLLNFRLPFLLATALSAGITTCLFIIRNNINALWIIAVAPATALIFIILAVTSKSFFPLAALAITLLFFILGAGICRVQLLLYETNQLQNNGVYCFSASVYERGQASDGDYLIIKNIRADGEYVFGKAIVYLPEIYGDYCEAGYKITFTASSVKYDTFAYGSLNYNVQSNVKYRLVPFGSIKAEHGFSIFGSIRNAVRNALYENLDNETAAVSYAMLTGNSQAVEESSMQSFRYGGIAHIFAVSGLHIGIVFGVLNLLMRKLRTKKFISAPLCICSVFFYAGICGFTLSSVRAAIMCSVTVIAKLFHKKYDGLNALSLAVILILAVFPLSIFSVGFQLSVCAVLGILFLSKNITKLFAKIKVPGKVGAAAGVSFGAQAGTMPVMLANFGYLSGAGLLLNLIIIPLLSVIFQLMFAATFISIVFKFASPYIIPAAALPLKAIVSFLVDAGFEKALICGFGAGAFTVFYFLFLLLLSDKLNLKIIQRAVASCCAAILLISYCLVNAFPSSSGYIITVSAYYNGGQTLIRNNGCNVLIVTQSLNTGQLKKFLTENYVSRPDVVIILGADDCANFYGELGIGCKNIYVCGEYPPLQPYGGSQIKYETQFNISGTDYEFISGGYVKVNCGGVTVGVGLESCDVYFDTEADIYGKTNVYYNASGAEFSIYEKGNVEITVNGGKYALR